MHKVQVPHDSGLHRERGGALEERSLPILSPPSSGPGTDAGTVAAPGLAVQAGPESAAHLSLRHTEDGAQGPDTDPASSAAAHRLPQRAPLLQRAAGVRA